MPRTRRKPKPRKQDERLHKRPPLQPRLDELRDLRIQKGYGIAYLASQLGITRLHLISIEQGRRRPSMELAARWLAALAPEARLSMFGELPILEQQIRALRLLEKLSPETFEAA